MRNFNLEKIIKMWAKEAGIEKAVGYRRYYKNEYNAIAIYTDRPGFMIGYHGKLINKYKKMIESSLYMKDVKIVFEELDGFVICEQQQK